MEQPRGDQPAFMLEHPAQPGEMLEVVSWWRTHQWKAFQASYDMVEVTVDQGELGGEAHKPTTLGGNLELRWPAEEILTGLKRRSRVGIGKTAAELMEDSRGLSRWTRS